MSRKNHKIEWPPTYKVKRHWRTKHIRLAYSKTAGLEVIVPRRFNIKKIPKILEENKVWIQQQEVLHRSPEPVTRPRIIDFLAINQRWTVNYLINNKEPRIKHFSNHEILLYGKISEFDVCHKKLLAWVKKEARVHLYIYFNTLSDELGLPYRDVTFRSQTTLWGSCSENNTISLNYKLIFLPHELMRYIMIHELCHTKHLDHSDRFWKLVSKYDPDYKKHDKAMKTADEFIPEWIYGKRSRLS